MIPRKYLNNRISILRKEIRQETQHVFSLYAKKEKRTEVYSVKHIHFKNNIVNTPDKGVIDHIVVYDNDTIIFPEGDDLDPVRLSKLTSIDDLMTLHAVAIELENRN